MEGLLRARVRMFQARVSALKSYQQKTGHNQLGARGAPVEGLAWRATMKGKDLEGKWMRFSMDRLTEAKASVRKCVEMSLKMVSLKANKKACLVPTMYQVSLVNEGKLGYPSQS